MWVLEAEIHFRQVYFTWVIRDFGSAEWFHSLLHAIEEQDTQNRIEINIYLTAKIKDDDMHNIIVSHLLINSNTGVIKEPRSKMSERRRTRSRLCVRPPTLGARTGTACFRPSLRSTQRQTWEYSSAVHPRFPRCCTSSRTRIQAQTVLGFISEKVRSHFSLLLKRFSTWVYREFLRHLSCFCGDWF